ncbi:hypothetical protein CCGE525_25650 (plasmid) [Rhizobium jaguaris]|uniref:Uncharacterized protein n=1 Tax=Rhizobium jaguaris TaxID=1312183 RepID=A0A387FYC8_9HYPH|nr:hypothetical protein CCGE525_25650 [Rhizobium jaguaris]
MTCGYGIDAIDEARENQRTAQTYASHVEREHSFQPSRRDGSVRLIGRGSARHDARQNSIELVSSQKLG